MGSKGCRSIWVGWGYILVRKRRVQRHEGWLRQLWGTEGDQSVGSVGGRPQRIQPALLWTVFFTGNKHNQICVFESSFWQLKGDRLKETPSPRSPHHVTALPPPQPFHVQFLCEHLPNSFHKLFKETIFQNFSKDCPENLQEIFLESACFLSC